MLELFTSNWILRSLVLVVLFGLVAFAAYSIANFSARRLRTNRSLAGLKTDTLVTPSGSLVGEGNQSAWARLSEKIERGGLDLSDSANDDLRRKLRAACYLASAAPGIDSSLPGAGNRRASRDPMALL